MKLVCCIGPSSVRLRRRCSLHLVDKHHHNFHLAGTDRGYEGSACDLLRYLGLDKPLLIVVVDSGQWCQVVVDR